MDSESVVEDRDMTPADELESMMRKISMFFSLASLSMMLTGFAIAIRRLDAIRVPGSVALSIGQLFSLHSLGDGFTEMTAGILLLAALPTAKILLAIWLNIRSRKWIESIVALIVLLELLFSAHL